MDTKNSYNTSTYLCLLTNPFMCNISSKSILLISFILRVGFFLFGLYQDKYMPLPYTDIDYYVFTDAAKFISIDKSPFLRATYRYTPLLAWLLLPTSNNSNELWFSFGKFLFIICDLITGYLTMVSLPSNLIMLSTIWLFNPMVITISTRGSSESLLTCFILFSSYLLIRSKGKSYFFISLSGLILGVSIHLKIYPLIYIPTFLLFIDSNQPIHRPITFKRLLFLANLLFGFTILTLQMYRIYGDEYINESFIYHLIRLDHRHNFSIYNISLYLHSAAASLPTSQSLIPQFEKLAFIPQLGLCVFAVPLSFRSGFNDLNQRDLLIYKLMFIQTFIFIILNKVCTSQYFIWFLCLLPQYLVNTTISLKKGLVLLTGWILTQGLWLFNGWRLEFRGDYNVFIFGLFTSSVLFFSWNIYLAGCFIKDVRKQIMVKPKKD